MSTPLGPQLVGENEKTLNALLRRILEHTGLSEAQRVTLRLAGQLDGRQCQRRRPGRDARRPGTFQ